MQDMTKGAATSSLVGFALPLLLSSVLQQLYNTVDTLIIGRYIGEDAFAAVGIAGTVMNILVFIIVGLTTGMSIIMAQQFGAHDESGFKREIYTAFVFGGSLTLLLSVVGILSAVPILRAISTPDAMLADASSYLITVLAGLLFTFLYNGYASMFRARGDSKSAMIFLAISLAIHVALAFLFVGTFHMGVMGAALSTVAAQAVSFVLCLIYNNKRYPNLKLLKEDRKLDPLLFKKTVCYGSVFALQQSTLYIGKLLVQSAINPLGSVAIAAYTAAAQIESFMLMPGSSISSAITTFIAQNRGARKFDRISMGFRKGFVLSFICTAVFAAAMFFLGGSAVSIFIQDATPEVIALGGEYFRAMALFYLLSALADSLQGYFRGIGRIYITFIATFIQIAVRVILCYIITSILALTGVAISTGVGWVFMVGFLFPMYLKQRKAFALFDGE